MALKCKMDNVPFLLNSIWIANAVVSLIKLFLVTAPGESGGLFPNPRACKGTVSCSCACQPSGHNAACRTRQDTCAFVSARCVQAG